MIDFKLYGKTKHIRKEIYDLASNVGGFVKFDKMYRITLTNAKAKTKKRIKAIEDFAKENNLKCFQYEYDGTEFTQKHIGSFSSFF